jgi:predicted DNA-binding WGR domain protein
MRVIKTVVILLAAFLIASCNGGGGGAGASKVKSFDYKLQGRWESNASSGAIYSGALVISYDRITITGYSETQTPNEGGDDNKRPFRQFPRDRAMKGYSEDSKIFIDNSGVSEGIPYTYWEDHPTPNYNLVKYLKFTFGGRDENLDYK